MTFGKTADGSEAATEIVFVYGTLKRGFCRHRIFPSGSFLGEAVTLPNWCLYDLGSYPGMIAESPGVAVRGELYRVSVRTLTELDEVEGVSSGLYRRERISVVPPIGNEAAPDRQVVWAYVYNRSTAGATRLGPVYE